MKTQKILLSILLVVLVAILAGSVMLIPYAKDLTAQGEPTQVPTEAPTQAPTEAPTDAPTEPPTEAPTDAPTEPPGPEIVEITLSFTGDCTFGRNQKHTYERSFDDVYDQNGPDYFFEKVLSVFENDDITVINLEGTLTTSDDIQKKQWNHRGRPEYVAIMTGSSVEVATLGNNHTMDYGVSGFEETVQVVSEAGITYCVDGVYGIHEVKGQKIGFVSVNPLYDGWAVKKWLEEGYEYLREQGCAVVIACMHYGGDKTPVIEKEQIALYHQVIDMGYDLVVGNHPHVLQAIEIYKGRYIAYSLGNFSYGGNKNPADKDSGIFQQTFTFVDGVLQYDLNAKFIPCLLSGQTNRNNYQPVLAEGEEYDRIIEKMSGYCAQFGLKMNEDGRVEPIEE